MNKFLLATVLVTGAILTRPATAASSCNPYPTCCVPEENPWKCAGGESDVQIACPICHLDASVHGPHGPIAIDSAGD